MWPPRPPEPSKRGGRRATETGLAGFAELLGILLEEVLAPDESEPNHARSPVARYHQLDLAITDPIAVGPALVVDFLNLNSGAQRHRAGDECADEPRSEERRVGKECRSR